MEIDNPSNFDHKAFEYRFGRSATRVKVLYLGLVEVDYHLISNIRFQRKGEIDELIRI